MNLYETIIILNPSHYEESRLKFEKMCKEFSKGIKVKKDDLGVKKLAYPIKEKFTEGYYIVFTWIGTPENVAELERQMRIDDDVLKFITVKKDDEEDMEYDDDSPDEVESEQEAEPIDALDVLLGFADYKKEVI